MRTKFTLSLFILLCIGSLSFTFAQPAKFLFINNNNGAGAANLDVEVRIMPADTLYVKVSNIAYLQASTQITVPSTTILKIVIKQAGTSTVYDTYTNQVLDPNVFAIWFFYGTATSKRFTSFS